MKNQNIHDFRRRARGHYEPTPEEIKKFNATREDVMAKIKEAQEDLKKKNGD